MYSARFEIAGTSSHKPTTHWCALTSLALKTACSVTGALATVLVQPIVSGSEALGRVGGVVVPVERRAWARVFFFVYTYIFDVLLRVTVCNATCDAV